MNNTDEITRLAQEIIDACEKLSCDYSKCVEEEMFWDNMAESALRGYVPKRSLVELQGDLAGLRAAYDALAGEGYPITETLEIADLMEEVENEIDTIDKQKDNDSVDVSSQARVLPITLGFPKLRD